MANSCIDIANWFIDIDKLLSFINDLCIPVNNFPVSINKLAISMKEFPIKYIAFPLGFNGKHCAVCGIKKERLGENKHTGEFTMTDVDRFAMKYKAADLEKSYLMSLSCGIID